MRDQFLVEIDTGDGGGGGRCGSLAELNRLFTAWCHQQYHRSRHSETGATPAERYHADDRARPPRPDPALLRRAFLWREQRKVTSFATVSLHGNRYQVDPALVGRTVDLLFTPFDLTVIEVEYQGRPMGHAVAAPHRPPRPPRRQTRATRPGRGHRHRLPAAARGPPTNARSARRSTSTPWPTQNTEPPGSRTPLTGEHPDGHR